MPPSVPNIPIENLALAFVPVLVVVLVLRRWSIGVWGTIYATLRMLGQLLLVGYVLRVIFRIDHIAVVGLTLTVMLLAASWIALRPFQVKSRAIYGRSLTAIAAGAGFSLLMMTQAVLRLEPWYQPRTVVLLGGMCLTAAMNCVSLAGERFEVESSAGVGYEEARRRAMQASLIVITNTLLAVGLVSLPGMMTGLILNNASPLIAARYQIMIMCMTYGAGGIASGVFLTLMKKVESQVQKGERGL